MFRSMHSIPSERREKRSTDSAEALQFLVEKVADRSGAPALVLVDDGGRIVAGTGMPDEVLGLARVARDVGHRQATVQEVEVATHGGDVAARSFAAGERSLTFAALTERMRGLGDAIRAVRRILDR
jgi:hypothetical protein